MDLSKLEEKISRIEQERRFLKRKLFEVKSLWRNHLRNCRDLEEARCILQDVAKEVQERVHDRIASIVTRCLRSVFDEPYEFRILFEKKRNKTEARLVFERDGLEVDPMTASGGGIVDIASFALRLSCLMIQKPRGYPILFLDEPFKFVSREYLGRVTTLLQVLTEELGLQLLIVSHIRRLEMGTVIRICPS